MKKFIFAFLGLLAVASVASAQTQQATAASKYQWDQDAPDLATATLYVYTAYVDSMPPNTITAVGCTGTGTPFLCMGAITPGLTAGNHTVTITAKSIAGESIKSAPLNFIFVTVPITPRNLKISG